MKEAERRAVQEKEMENMMGLRYQMESRKELEEEARR